MLTPPSRSTCTLRLMCRLGIYLTTVLNGPNVRVRRKASQSSHFMFKTSNPIELKKVKYCYVTSKVPFFSNKT